MARFHFTTSDVFTDRPFAGNRLAVFSDASTMSEATMQAIAREFDYPETVFVLPAEDPADNWPVRIFTPGREIPFAGHPTIGTALALVRLGKVAIEDDRASLVLHEKAGPVTVEVACIQQKPQLARLETPQKHDVIHSLPASPITEALGLTARHVANPEAPVLIAGCGLPFAFLELVSVDALQAITIDAAALERALAPHKVGMHVFVRNKGPGENNVRARMFAPHLGIPEDPATGSAAAGLAGILALQDDRASGRWQGTIEQGVEMGRPSRIMVEAIKNEGTVDAVFVEGGSVPMSEGWFEVKN